MGHAQLAGDDAGPDAVVGHLHDLVADMVGQRPAVDKYAAELIDSALAKGGGHWGQKVKREARGRSFQGNGGKQPERRARLTSHCFEQPQCYSLGTSTAHVQLLAPDPFSIAFIQSTKPFRAT